MPVSRFAYDKLTDEEKADFDSHAFHASTMLTFLLIIVPSTVSAMKAMIASVFLLAVFTRPAAGQLAAPNAAGVSLGHIHLYVSDVPAQQKFWAMMGGVPVANQKLEMIQFPGVFILLRRAETKGGTVGSIVNHLGFVWKDLPAAKAKWQAAGYKIEQNEDPNHGYILGPDGFPR